MDPESFLDVGALPAADSDGEDSFVVLGSHSLSDDSSTPQEDVLPLIRVNKVRDMQNLLSLEISQISTSPERPETSSQPSSTVSNGVGPDSSYDDVQKHVENLIKENEKLKNALAQNNISMKSQYERIVLWKDEVNSVIISYKDKLAEAKAFIDKSKDENSKMASELEVYRNIKKLQEEEIFNLKQKVCAFQDKQTGGESDDDNTSNGYLAAMKKKIEDLENALAETNLEKADVTRENEQLSSKLSNSSNNEQVFVELKQEIAAAKSRETDLKQIEVRLRSKVEELGQITYQVVVKSEQLEIAKMKITELEAILKQTTDELERTRSEFEKVTSNIQPKEAQIAKLQEQINNLTASFEITNTKLMEVESYNRSLGQDYQTTRQQLLNSQVTITTLNHELGTKMRHIESLTAMLPELASKDEIFALKQQLQIFKNDFEAERHSKELLKRERDQLADDVKNLQNRNGQLQNEVERLRLMNELPSGDASFLCPKCAFGFNSYQSLENHVHRCLDLEGFP